MNQLSSSNLLLLQTLHTRRLLRRIFWISRRICQKSNFSQNLCFCITFKWWLALTLNVQKGFQIALHCKNFTSNSNYFHWNLAGIILCRQIELIWHFWHSCKTYLIHKKKPDTYGLDIENVSKKLNFILTVFRFVNPTPKQLKC